MTPELKHEALNACRVGFEFEFYTNYQRQEASRLLSKELEPKIVLGRGKVIGKKTNLGASSKPTANLFRLIPDFSGGGQMKELVTGPLPYHEARIVLRRVLKWIEENGWTSEKCGLHINISFDEFYVKLACKLSHLDKLKFILQYDESKIFKAFPNRQGNIYARGIKQVFPVNRFMNLENIKAVSKDMYLTPNTKYYSVNFDKIKNNYLEFRSIGGAGYEKKSDEILDILEYNALTLFECLNNPEYTEDNVFTLNKILSDHKNTIGSFSNLEIFMLKFPKIKIFVDLKGDTSIITQYFSIIKDKLFDLILFGGLDNALINYDTDISRLQIKGASFKDSFLIKDVDLINCNASGILEDCKLWNCKISKAHLEDCEFVYANSISDSKITRCEMGAKTTINGCYIENGSRTINGKINDSIIRSGQIAETAKIDSKTEIIKLKRKVRKYS
jgi:hypothetical protein